MSVQTLLASPRNRGSALQSASAKLAKKNKIALISIEYPLTLLLRLPYPPQKINSKSVSWKGCIVLDGFHPTAINLDHFL